MRGIFKALSAAAAFLLLLDLPSAIASGYKVGARDKLRIKVYEWPALSNEVVVGADGILSLPLIGEIDTAGKSTTEVADAIGRGLQTTAKLPEFPHVSVEVSQYRPFYILGEVQEPGEYPFRPGLTVLMAVGVAKGLYRPPAATEHNVERVAIESRENLVAAQAKQRELRVRLARLRAELGGADSFEPERIPGEEEYPPAVIQQERMILKARVDALQHETAGLRREIEISKEEIKFLQSRKESAMKQQVSVDKEMASLRDLMDKGLGLAPRQAEVERLKAQVEGDQRDIDTRIVQVRKRIATSEASIAKLADERQANLMLEIRAVTGQLADLANRVALQRDLMAEAETLRGAISQSRSEGRSVRLAYRIVRPATVRPREFAATGNDLVEPGDVITVEQEAAETPEAP